MITQKGKEKEKNSRFGMLLVAGYPNAGKSTLVNTLVGHWSTAVTHKRHTTSRPTMAIFSQGESQIVLTDMPGFPLWNGTSFMNADGCLLVVDAHKRASIPKDFVSRCKIPLIIVLNKIDMLAKKEVLLQQAQEITALCSPQALFMCSARKGDGCQKLATTLAQIVPEGPWMYDTMKVRTNIDIAHDITREKLLCHTHQEIPYVAQIEGMIDDNVSHMKIVQTIILPRKEQRQHAVGTNGETIKRVQFSAKRRMEEVFSCPVSLRLRVEKKSHQNGNALV